MGGISTGLAVALLLFTKITFFAGALLTIAGWPIINGLAGITYAALERANGAVPLMRSPGLAGFRIRDKESEKSGDSILPFVFKYWLARSKPSSTKFAYFFSYALRMEPSRGGASCLHFGSTFNDKSHPSPERLFGDADVVMMPVKFSEDGSRQSIPRIYGPVLESHYHLKATSAQWRLYRRNL